MLEKNLDIIYNKPYLVIVPMISRDYLEAFSFSFGNTILISDNIIDYEKTLAFINKNNFKKLIFVDYQVEYERLAIGYDSDYEIDCIYTGSLGGLSNINQYTIFKKVIELHEKYKNSNLGVLDEGLFNVLKKKYKNVKLISIDVKQNICNNFEFDNSIGILNDCNNPNHSFYNCLSAVKLIDNAIVKISNLNKATKSFLKTFKIKIKKEKILEKLYSKNLVNLYVNFTCNNNLLILKSMDSGVPCIIGNNNIFNSNKILKKYLVVDSDDDINEIAQKIQDVKKYRNKILDEYKKFRNEYSKNSKISIENFLGYKEKTKNKKEVDDILLSVIFPVYNTEKYIAKSLDSIIKAKINNMEILVINDGSTDNSEKVIEKYIKKYPKLIRYIKQENHGLGNVRNVGLKEAKGKYLAAVDSDDTINSKYFQEAHEYMKKDIDIIVYDWMTVTENGNYETAAIDYIYNNINRYKGIMYTTIMPSTCNKIIKKSLFDELNLEYIEDKYEDLSTNPFVLLRAQTIKYINRPYYEYYIRNNSIMRTKPGNSMIDIIKIVNSRIEKYKESININIEEFKFNTFIWRIEEYIINPLYDLEDKEMRQSIKHFDKNIKDIFIDLTRTQKYKDMLEKLGDNKKIKYIKERNKMYREGRLEEFILKNKKNNTIQKLTPPDVVYGKR